MAAFRHLVAVQQAFATAALVLAASGCWVAETKQYPASPNEPPFIVYQGTIPPLNSVIEVPLEEPTADAGLPASIHFSVQIFDRNVDQTLHGRHILDDTGVGIPMVQDINDIPTVTSGARERRTVIVDLPRTYFPNDGRCHRLELLISSQFGIGRTAVDPQDLAEAAWTVVLYREGQMLPLPGCAAVR